MGCSVYGINGPCLLHTFVMLKLTWMFSTLVSHKPESINIQSDLPKRIISVLVSGLQKREEDMQGPFITNYKISQTNQQILHKMVNCATPLVLTEL